MKHSSILVALLLCGSSLIAMETSKEVLDAKKNEAQIAIEALYRECFTHGAYFKGVEDATQLDRKEESNEECDWYRQ